MESLRENARQNRLQIPSRLGTPVEAPDGLGVQAFGAQTEGNGTQLRAPVARVRRSRRRALELGQPQRGVGLDQLNARISARIRELRVKLTQPPQRVVCLFGASRPEECADQIETDVDPARLAAEQPLEGGDGGSPIVIHSQCAGAYARRLIGRQFRRAAGDDAGAACGVGRAAHFTESALRARHAVPRECLPRRVSAR
jgi:hypothetical protein